MYLKDNDIINILRDPKWIRNVFRIGLTKSCVIGSFIHNKKSKLYILFLIYYFRFEADVLYDNDQLYFVQCLDE